LLRLEPLEDDAVATLLRRALADEDRGLGRTGLAIADDAREHLVTIAGGDARMALTGLEAAAEAARAADAVEITREIAADAVQKKAIVYDRQGDAHYDVISAFIKSIRGSDPDAALFWLARMIEAGEDPRFIARRLIVHASEDIGMADSRALLVAVAAAQAVEHVGLPEVRLNLAHATVYLATAPKSNSVYSAIGAAFEDAPSAEPVPLHLRDASYRGAKQLGHGQGYRYPHDFPGHAVEQAYRPASVSERRYYRPSGQGEDVERRPGTGEPAGAGGEGSGLPEGEKPGPVG
jgi:putative ATPase